MPPNPPHTIPITPTTDLGTSVDFLHFTSHIATYRDQGRRPEQQDETLIIAPLELSPLLLDRPSILSHIPNPLAIIAVMDGHGYDGGKISGSVRTNFLHDAKKHFVDAFCRVFDKNNLPNSSAGHETIEKLTHNAIHSSLQLCYESLHTHLTTDSNLDAYNSGSTLITAVITSSNIYIANVGDSRAVLGIITDNGVIDSQVLSNDHTCANKDELNRILKHGGRVDYSPSQDNTDSNAKGPLRIYKGNHPYPGLVVTRALGDSASSSLGVLYIPEITQVSLTPYLMSLPPPSVLILILASDGVWDAQPKCEDSGNKVISVIYSVLYRAHSQGVRIGPKVANVAVKKVVKTALQGLDNQQLDDNVSAACAILTIHKAPPLAYPAGQIP